MERPRVLYIGLEPSLLDPNSMPGFDPETVAAGVRREIARLEEHGYDARWCPVDRGETAERTVADALAREPIACVVIGAGLRVNPLYFTLFEKLVNAVHRGAPTAPLCFNTKPSDTLEAVERWIRPRGGPV